MSEMKQIKELIRLLDFVDAETKFFSHEYGTISLVWPRLSALILQLESLELETTCAKEAQAAILEDLRVRCAELFRDPILHISTILDPEWKN